MSKAKKSTSKASKTITVKKPNQRVVIASVLLTLPKEGMTKQQIAERVHKKTGGSLKDITIMVRDFGNFSVYLKVIQKKEDKFYLSL